MSMIDEIDAAAQRTREALGLPAAGRVVATGHQPGLWHAGIVAKSLAAAADGGAVLHVIVDHEPLDLSRVEVPVLDEARRLAIGVVRLGTAAAPRASGWQAPLDPSPQFPLGLAWPAAREAIERAAEALRVAGQEHAVARSTQFTQAMFALIEVVRRDVRVRPAACVSTSELLSLPLGRRLVQAMVDDPPRCAQAWSLAASEEPAARLPALAAGELPLWVMDPNGHRRTARLDDARRWLSDGALPRRLAPRAVVTSGIARAGLCDLFIHGRGGGVYDRAGEKWMRHWLGIEPAPISVVSADEYLPLEDFVPLQDRVDGAALAQVEARAHRTWHDPEPPPARGAAGPGEIKRQMLSAINDLPRGSEARRRSWRAMHRQLEVMRSREVGRVNRDMQRAADASAGYRSWAIARKRDWPWIYAHAPAHLNSDHAPSRARGDSPP